MENKVKQKLMSSLSRYFAVKECNVYLNSGCSHVDGLLCNYPECDILLKYKKRRFKADVNGAKRVYDRTWTRLWATIEKSKKKRNRRLTMEHSGLIRVHSRTRCFIDRSLREPFDDVSDISYSYSRSALKDILMCYETRKMKTKRLSAGMTDKKILINGIVQGLKQSAQDYEGLLEARKKFTMVFIEGASMVYDFESDGPSVLEMLDKDYEECVPKLDSTKKQRDFEWDQLRDRDKGYLNSLKNESIGRCPVVKLKGRK